jgi:translation initiation factor IF-2
VLESSTGLNIESAGPSTPVIIVGFKALPEFGESFIAVKDEKEARTKSNAYAIENADTKGSSDMSSGELIRLINQKTQQQELNIIVKADVQGSLTSVIDSVKTLDTEDVAIRVVGSGVGAVTENDIRMASSSNAIIYGFHVDMPLNIKQLASRDKVRVRLYKIIYELIDDAKESMSNLLAPEEVITEVGRLVVRGVFKTTKTDLICGGEVTKGKLVIPAFANIIRDGEELAKGLTVVGLKHGPTDTKEVLMGEMCGISLSTNSRIDVQDGDHIELYTSEFRERSL